MPAFKISVAQHLVRKNYKQVCDIAVTFTQTQIVSFAYVNLVYAVELLLSTLRNLNKKM